MRLPFQNLNLISGKIPRGAESVRLAVLITTKKEICIDLALNPLFYLAGPPRCGFPSTFPVSALPSRARAEERQSPERVFKTFLD